MVHELQSVLNIFFLSVKQSFSLSQMELSRTELAKGTPSILMENSDHIIRPVLLIQFDVPQPISLGFLKSLSLSHKLLLIVLKSLVLW